MADSFPGLTGSYVLRYSINPSYYADMIAGSSLAAYLFEMAAQATTVYIAAKDLGNTGWRYTVYEDGSAQYRNCFVYNATTLEVIRYNAAVASTTYWREEDVLDAFAQGGVANFFAELNLTRNSASASTTSDVIAGWSPYYDALRRKLEQLTSQPGWQDVTAISDRVTIIRSELATANASMGATNLATLVDSLEEARLETKTWNETRYEQLIRAAAGTITETGVMSYPELSKHMLDTYFTTLTTSFEELESEQEQTDQAVVDEWDSVWSVLESQFDGIIDQAKQDVNDTFDFRVAQMSQSMIDRGVYNANNLDSEKAGIETLRSNELRRLEESLGQQKVELRQAVLSGKVQSLAQQAQNQLSLNLQTRGWQADLANRLQTLYQLAPGVVERRTDVGPSLADVYNATMNMGRGEASQQLLSALQPQQVIANAEQAGFSPGLDFQELAKLVNKG